MINILIYFKKWLKFKSRMNILRLYSIKIELLKELLFHTLYHIINFIYPI